jgi:serine protease Do/serine protease DegQ
MSFNSRGTITVLFILAFGLFTTQHVDAALPWAVDDQQLPSLAPMLDKTTPAVVNIATEGRVRVQNPLLEDPFFRFFFDIPNNQPMEQKTQSLGSGVIVDAERGLVITNNHVIANAEQITVKLRDGRKVEAKKIGADPETDIAVIQIPSKNLTALSLADSSKLRVGDFVVAIGNPFGLGQTVTSGIVSALGRSGLGIEGYEDFIQTDASINPGNSGGALVNLDGQLVGINTAIFSPSQGGGNIGIGFAIPVNMAKQVMENLVLHGEVKRGFLGAQLQDLDPELAEAFDLSNQEGAVLVNIVHDSPAEKAGLKAGDVVVGINGRSVRNAADLRNQVGLLPVGSKVALDVVRKGMLGPSREQITAVIAEQTATNGSAASIKNPRLSGATFGDIPEESSLHGQVEGVMVYGVKQGSRAWASGLREGDIIDSVNQVPVSNMKEFLAKAGEAKSGLLLHVHRGNASAFMVIR